LNNKVNYTLVGFLVLFGATLMIAFTFWLLKPTINEQNKIYNILFDESVLGLNIDAAVKYRGIDVGKVTRLRINPKDSEQVEVQVTILKSTPIKETTVAKLTSQGITGLSYINLSLGDNNSSLLVAKDDEEYPVIKTEASFLEKLEESFGSVSIRLSETLSRMEELLNEKNQKEVAALLKSSASFMRQMDKVISDEAIDNLHDSLKNLNSASKKLDALMPKVDKFVDNSIEWEDKISSSLASIMNSYIGIEKAMDEFKKAVKDGEFNIKEITSDLVPTINKTFLEFEYLIVRLKETLNQHERSPSDILFMKEEIKKGPGEK
jgi:phospholipid/cholesterol/gamma-HCH transport system substrate-binding protein